MTTAATRSGTATSAAAQWPRPESSVALTTTAAVAAAAAMIAPRRNGPGELSGPSERIAGSQILAKVGERPRARDLRDRVEVVRRRRRGRVPLERVREPRIVAGALAAPARGARRGGRAAPPRAVTNAPIVEIMLYAAVLPCALKLDAPARLPLVAEQELDEERAVEADEEQDRRPAGEASRRAADRRSSATSRRRRRAVARSAVPQRR